MTIRAVKAPGSHVLSDQPTLGIGDQPIQGDAVPTPGLTTCSYTGKRFFLLHGPGAKRYWRQKTERLTGPDGVTSLGTMRKYFYTCDFGPHGRG